MNNYLCKFANIRTTTVESKSMETLSEKVNNTIEQLENDGKTILDLQFSQTQFNATQTHIGYIFHQMIVYGEEKEWFLNE